MASSYGAFTGAAVAKVDLPFWVVIERQQQFPPQTIPCDEEGALVAFKNTSKLLSFLDRRGQGKWELFKMESRDELVLLIAQVHRDGARSVCFDPEPDGGGGEHVTLGELFGLIDRTA